MSTLALHQSLLGASGGPAPTYEDLTTYTEVDGAGVLSKTASRATWSGVTRNTSAYIYKDFGAGFFSGDVTVDFDARLTSSSGTSFVEAVGFANQLGDASNANRTNSMGVFLYNGNSVHLREMDGGSNYSQSGAISLSTTYYMRFRRDESVGTYGTIYLYVATSDANRNSGTWLHTLSVTLHSSMKDYRYFYATASLNDSNVFPLSGWAENFLIS